MENEPVYNGLYLIADTPKTLHPLVTEKGTGDIQLLKECLVEELGIDAQMEVRAALTQEIDHRLEMGIDNE